VVLAIFTACVELGFFLTKSAMGFQFTFIGFTIKCMLLYSGSKFSCSINAKIFSIIADTINYVIKEVDEFFSDSGRVIATKIKEEFKATTKAFSKGVKESVGYVKNYSGDLVGIETHVFKDLKNKFEEDLKWMKNGFKNATTRADKILSQADNVAKKKAEIILCDTKYAFNKKKENK
jgi:hypothetical protein